MVFVRLARNVSGADGVRQVTQSLRVRDLAGTINFALKKSSYSREVTKFAKKNRWVYKTVESPVW
jgi:hypothetical protein